MDQAHFYLDHTKIGMQAHFYQNYTEIDDFGAGLGRPSVAIANFPWSSSKYQPLYQKSIRSINNVG